MTSITMQAFHNDPNIKATYLARVRAHRLADELVHGLYWMDGKGCAVGCTVHSDNHAAYETELGIPRIVARLEDRFFEGMSNGAAQEWPEQFLEAIPVGADLSNVWREWALWMLFDDEWGVVKHAKTEQVRDAIWHVGMLYAAECEGVEVPVDEWRKARAAAAAAYAAAAAAAYAAAATYAAYAALAATTYAYATAVTYAAATAAAGDAAFCRAASFKLLDIIRAAPILPLTRREG